MIGQSIDCWNADNIDDERVLACSIICLRRISLLFADAAVELNYLPTCNTSIVGLRNTGGTKRSGFANHSVRLIHSTQVPTTAPTRSQETHQEKHPTEVVHGAFYPAQEIHGDKHNTV